MFLDSDQRSVWPIETALLRFMLRAQSSLDRVCGVENRVLLRRRHACFGLTIVQMHSPPPPGWAGCLDDLILDTLVLHAGNNGPREQRFLSGFGLTIQNRPLRKSIRPPAPLTACLLRVRNGPDALEMGFLFYPRKQKTSGCFASDHHRRHDTNRQSPHLCEVPTFVPASWLRPD
jgi:hypothetical protein